MLLFLILLYSISIPFWLCVRHYGGDCKTDGRPPLLLHAANNFPSAAWVFRFANLLEELVISPIILIGAAIIAVTEFFSWIFFRKEFCNKPSFYYVNDFVLEKETKQFFDECENQLSRFGLYSKGTFKASSPSGLDRLVRYFVSNNGKKFAAAYSLFGTRQLFVGSLTKNGCAILLTGLTEDHFKEIESSEQCNTFGRWLKINDMRIPKLLGLHRKIESDWCLRNNTKVQGLNPKRWKKAFVRFSEIGKLVKEQSPPTETATSSS